MEDEDRTEPPRLPTQSDLIKLCRELNAQSAKYLVVGGMAVIEHGFLRATEDIDILVESSRENQLKVRRALEILPDKAVRQLVDNDLDDYLVVRVADEFVVDLMLKTCGISYEEAVKDVEVHTLQGVAIPFVSPRTLLRMKQTVRERDAIDRAFLEQKLGGRK